MLGVTRDIHPGGQVACLHEAPGCLGTAGRVLGRVQATGNGLIVVHGHLLRAERFVRVEQRVRVAVEQEGLWDGNG